MISFPSLKRVAGLAHGVTTREGGVSVGCFASLNLGRSTGDAAEAVRENRRRAAARLGFTGLVNARQVHGTRVVEVLEAGADPGEADALITDRPGLLLAVLGADCPGVLLVDERRHALAVVHSGWRGTAAGVSAAALRALLERYGTRPEDLRAAVGPGISARRYEVGPEVAEALAPWAAGQEGLLARGRDDRWHVDLTGLIVRGLVGLGVPPAAIEVSRLCTYEEQERLFSHRRDGGRAGRHALLAGFSA